MINNKGIIMKIAMYFVAALLVGCGGPSGPRGDTGAIGATGPQGVPGTSVTPSPVPSESAVQVMVDNENAYRLNVGQEPLTPGLTCNLYTVPNTTTAIIGATSLVSVGAFGYHGVFNQAVTNTSAGLNVLPAALQSVYQTWYILKCTGQLVVSDDNWHEFDLTSDDGSNLYLDGLLINNDGIHSSQTKTGAKYIKYGFHSFEIDELQGAGQESFILNEDGAVMSSNGFYH